MKLWRGQAQHLAWGSVALAVACIPLTNILIAHAQPGSLGIAAELRTPFPWVGILAFAIVGAMIVSRHPDHLVGWIFCLSGLSAASSAVAEAYAELGRAAPGSLPLVNLVSAVSDAAFVIGFMAPVTIGLLLFPDGRLESRRWRPVLYFAITSLAMQFIGKLVAPMSAGVLIFSAGIAGSVISALAGLASLAIRWRTSPDDARQQIKWVGMAGLLVAADLTFVIVLSLLTHYAIDPFLAFDVAYTSVPIAVGIAILRYHLYDVDLIINKALVYIGLTAILGGLYALVIDTSQRLLVAFTGPRSDAAVLLTAFLVAAAFTPVRDGLRRLADHYVGARDPVVALEKLASSVESVVKVLDSQRLAHALAEESLDLFDAAGVRLQLNIDGRDPLVQSQGHIDRPAVTVALHGNGQVVGSLVLASRRGDMGYSQRDLAALQIAADSVGQALVVGSSLRVPTNALPAC